MYVTQSTFSLPGPIEVANLLIFARSFPATFWTVYNSQLQTTGHLGCCTLSDMTVNGPTILTAAAYISYPESTKTTIFYAITILLHIRLQFT